VSMEDYAAEWKWGRIRVQIVHAAARRGFTAAPATTSPAAPDVAKPLQPGGARRELLVKGAFQGGAETAQRRASTRSSSARPQERVRQDARRLSRLRPALRHPL
jgi:hypothetical protein